MHKEVFEMGFFSVIGVAAGFLVVASVLYAGHFIVQFSKRYRQAVNPQYGINLVTTRERIAFATHAALFWPTV